MNQTLSVLDPTSEDRSTEIQLSERIKSIEGSTIGLLDIAKPRGDIFLNQLEKRLTEHGATVLRFMKPTFTKPAPVDLRYEISSKCDAVIEALAD
ncbi:MAG: hypothetical protein MB54_02900 [marine actinobacterium MedAcidi-G2B]|nr:MAG: hypothetical protein MB54_02900 [marine actinobacterium MedAcidi-G2B]MAU50331.1 hypothetical protein [Actinomycetota bacterium]MDC0245645.1 hypothetical protein [Acidimicrobiaceae bacterium]|tara:strand:- start:615 stop:899 length:285 start_codon:yes stop_codon:yes gene_type:complete